MVCAVASAADNPVRTPPEVGTQTRTLTHQGATRTDRIRIPRGYNAAQPVPLLLVFHGGEGSPQAAEWGLGFNPLADRHGFIVAYPQGTANPAQGFGWNDGRVSPRFPGREKVDDVGFIRELITRVSAEFNVDARRIYATGNSNGGFMVQRLGWELSDLLAAIAPCAGTLGPEFAQNFAPRHPVHVLAMHGTLDPAVPFFGGEVIGRGGYAISRAAWSSSGSPPTTASAGGRNPAENDPRCDAGFPHHLPAGISEAQRSSSTASRATDITGRAARHSEAPTRLPGQARPS
jgi:polyhydroxybutyrate depolymerase